MGWDETRRPCATGVGDEVQLRRARHQRWIWAAARRPPAGCWRLVAARFISETATDELSLGDLMRQ